MSKNRDRRRMKRISWESWVTIEDSNTGRVLTGILYNFNSEGIYFECDAPLKNGSELSVKVENLPETMHAKVFRAEVKWAEEIVAPVVMHNYGVGACYARMGGRPDSRSDGLKVIPGGMETAQED